MASRILSFGVLVTALGSLLFVAPAQAQATRTWVSGVGDDANPCSRTAPCKTFAGAISKTAAGGEISVLDPGGFGVVTITKSISITSDWGGEAGILASGTNGITINAGANDVVNIRGIVIDGAPPATPGLNGIRFLAGRALNVQNCVIKNFGGAAPNGNGILFAPGAGFTGELFVNDCILSNNGSGGNGNGIAVKPTGTGAAKVILNNVSIENNDGGLRIDGTGSTGGIRVTMSDSVVGGNTFQGIVATTPVGGAAIRLFITRSTIASNATIGIQSDGASTQVLLSGSTITGNDTGLLVTSGGQLLSFQNNSNSANITANGAPSGTIPLQ